MTEPRRSVSGLNRVSTGSPGTPGARPVNGDLSALRAKNRASTPPPPPPAAAPPVAAVEEPAEKKQTNKPVTVYISQEVYTRARLTYKATSSAERDRNWSQFVEKAIAGEIERRELRHNAGDPFDGVDTPLSPGRPLAD